MDFYNISMVLKTAMACLVPVMEWKSWDVSCKKDEPVFQKSVKSASPKIIARPIKKEKKQAAAVRQLIPVFLMEVQSQRRKIWVRC